MLDGMFPHTDDALFAKCFPRWVSLGIFLPTVIAMACGIFLSSFMSQVTRQLCLGFGLFGFGLSSIWFTYHGVRLGFLPGRFLVSRSATPIRFWLTVAMLLCFALPMFLVGIFGIYVSVFGSHAN